MTVTGSSARSHRGRRLGSSCSGSRGARGSTARGFRNRGDHDSGRVAVGVGVGDGLAVLAGSGASTSASTRIRTTSAVSTGCWCLSVRSCIPAAAYRDGYRDCGWRGTAVSWTGQGDGCCLGGRWDRCGDIGRVARGCLVGRRRQPGAVVGGAALGVDRSRAWLEGRLGDGLGHG